jgi:hypothetical protein
MMARHAKRRVLGRELGERAAELFPTSDLGSTATSIKGGCAFGDFRLACHRPGLR